jgi:hypothetical protein
MATRRPTIRRVVQRDQLGLRIPTRRFNRRRIYATAAGPDTLRIYLTGAILDGGDQNAQASSLGNYRASTEAVRVGFIVSTPIPNIEILAASRSNAVEDTGGLGLGTGSIFATNPNSLSYAAPQSVTPGSAVTITNGETQLLQDGDDLGKWVRVRKTDAEQLAGGEAIEFLDVFNDVFGMSNGTAAGGNHYRAVMIRNDFSVTVTGLKLFVKPLISTHVVSSILQLGATGAGTIEGPADSFCTWPWKGWVRIETSGGVLKEIAYYSSRTDSILTVPLLGRGRLGTTAAAGAATDKIWSVPGIRIGFELANPEIGGSVQTIPNETTAPNTAAFLGTAWSTAITAETGIQVGTLDLQEQGALWIHRELPAGISAIAKALNMIGVAYSDGTASYTEILAGMYRVADSALARYEIFFATGGNEPDLTAPPNEITPTLPYDSIYVVPASTIVKVAVAYRNQYDLSSGSLSTTTIDVSGTGVEQSPIPITPSVISLTATAGGTVRLIAEYDYVLDSNPADVWRVYLTSDGSEPSTANLLTSVAMVRPGSVGRVILDYTIGAYANGTVVKIKVAVYRTSDGRISALSATATAIADTSAPDSPSGSIGQRANYQQSQN